MMRVKKYLKVVFLIGILLWVWGDGAVMASPEMLIQKKWDPGQEPEINKKKGKEYKEDIQLPDKPGRVNIIYAGKPAKEHKLFLKINNTLIKNRELQIYFNKKDKGKAQTKVMANLEVNPGAILSVVVSGVGKLSGLTITWEVNTNTSTVLAVAPLPMQGKDGNKDDMEKMRQAGVGAWIPTEVNDPKGKGPAEFKLKDYIFNPMLRIRGMEAFAFDVKEMSDTDVGFDILGFIGGLILGGLNWLNLVFSVLSNIEIDSTMEQFIIPIYYLSAFGRIGEEGPSVSLKHADVLDYLHRRGAFGFLNLGGGHEMDEGEIEDVTNAYALGVMGFNEELGVGSKYLQKLRTLVTVYLGHKDHEGLTSDDYDSKNINLVYHNPIPLPDVLDPKSDEGKKLAREKMNEIFSAVKDGDSVMGHGVGAPAMQVEEIFRNDGGYQGIYGIAFPYRGEDERTFTVLGTGKDKVIKTVKYSGPGLWVPVLDFKEIIGEDEDGETDTNNKKPPKVIVVRLTSKWGDYQTKVQFQPHALRPDPMLSLGPRAIIGQEGDVKGLPLILLGERPFPAHKLIVSETNMDYKTAQLGQGASIVLKMPLIKNKAGAEIKVITYNPEQGSSAGYKIYAGTEKYGFTYIGTGPQSYADQGNTTDTFDAAPVPGGEFDQVKIVSVGPGTAYLVSVEATSGVLFQGFNSAKSQGDASVFAFAKSGDGIENPWEKEKKDSGITVLRTNKDDEYFEARSQWLVGNRYTKDYRVTANMKATQLGEKKGSYGVSALVTIFGKRHSLDFILKKEKNDKKYAVLRVVRGVNKKDKPPKTTIIAKVELPKDFKLKDTLHKISLAVIGLDEDELGKNFRIKATIDDNSKIYDATYNTGTGSSEDYDDDAGYEPDDGLGNKDGEGDADDDEGEGEGFLLHNGGMIGVSKGRLTTVTVNDMTVEAVTLEQINAGK